jgi:hypothetical protein
MATAAQIQANRANAQKSTGPRTPEGKETASQNAVTHGLLAREGIIRGEDEEQYREHAETLMTQLSALSPLEEILADRIIDLTWRLKRAAQDQDAVFAALYEKQEAAQESQEPGGDAATLGRMLVADFTQEAVLERLQRYERRIESSLYRTLKELWRLQDREQKKDDETADLLGPWRRDQTNAERARAFAPCPPREVSPGPAGGTPSTPRTEAPHYATAATLEASSAGPTADELPADKTCETNPNSDPPQAKAVREAVGSVPAGAGLEPAEGVDYGTGSPPVAQSDGRMRRCSAHLGAT